MARKRMVNAVAQLRRIPCGIQIVKRSSHHSSVPQLHHRSRHYPWFFHLDTGRNCSFDLRIGRFVEVFLVRKIVWMPVESSVLAVLVEVVELVCPGGIPGHVETTLVRIDPLGETAAELTFGDRIVPRVALYQRLVIEKQVPDVGHYGDVHRTDVPVEFLRGYPQPLTASLPSFTLFSTRQGRPWVKEYPRTTLALHWPFQLLLDRSLCRDRSRTELTLPSRC